MNSYLAALFTFIILLAFLRLMYFLAQHGFIKNTLSRALIYIGTGSIFVLCWLMYPDVQNGRWLAALVPLAAIIYFALIGTGIIRDEAAVKAMTLTGNRREMLYGPILYSIVLIAMTVIYWKDSLYGLPALTILCGGVGSAELFGLRHVSSRLPWSPGKSIARAGCVFMGGWLMSMLVLEIFILLGFFSGPLSRFFLPITWIALTAAVVDVLPLRELDTLIVPIVCVLIGYLVF